MSFDFSTTTHGKWILAGEHAVLRGHPALVFPVTSKSLSLSYASHEKNANATFSGTYSDDAHLFFWSVLERAMELVDHSLGEIKGHFTLHNEIPIGAGMGASAALCVAIARWCSYQGFITKTKITHFAKQLEDLFHNESSGIDIAGAATDKGLIFHRSRENEPLSMTWQPTITLSFSGELGITSHCVKKVKNLWEQDPALAKRIDLDMAEAVTTAIKALSLDKAKGLPLLAGAIQQAHTCFHQWGLAEGRLNDHIHTLLKQGALAAKPTGSGQGGFVLCLWENLPPLAPLPFELIQG